MNIPELPIVHKFAKALLVGAVTINVSAALLFAAPTAQARNWEIFDKGEHLLLPEGPIELDNVIMVPLRPIALRFGYTFTKSTSKEVIISRGVKNKVVLKPGSKTVTFNDGSKQTISKEPTLFNGNLFVPLDFASTLANVRYTVIPGTSVISLRPAPNNSASFYNTKALFAVYNLKDGFQFINNKGTIVINPSDKITMSSDFGLEEFTPVHKDDKGIGYIDHTGKLAITANHYQLEPFNEGMAAFQDQTGIGSEVKMGFLNRTGQIVIPTKYDRVYPFSNGLAKVVQGGKSFYIDHNGKTVITPASGITLSADGFSEGMAAVSTTVQSNGKTVSKIGFINTKGELVIKPAYDAVDSFSEGLAGVLVNGKIGFIDKQGKWVIQPRYDATYPASFHNGYATVRVQASLLKNTDLYTNYLLDAKGNKVSQITSEKLGNYSEGLLAFEKNGLWGYMNIRGKTIIKPSFPFRGSDFQNGTARVTLGIDGSAMIDKSGKIIWEWRIGSQR